MLTTKFDARNSLIEEILDAPLGHVITALGNYLNCKIKLDLIEQNSSNPGSTFERKITITANHFPLIKAVIKFDKNILPKYVVRQLLQKRKLVGTIMNLYEIPNKKDIVFLNVEKGKKITRIYQIKFDNNVFFEVSEEIRLDCIDTIEKEFGIKRRTY